MTNKSKVYAIKSKVEKKLLTVNEKQDDGSRAMSGQYILPRVQRLPLAEAYDNSFIISGICDKIATSCDSGFEPISETPDPELENFLERMDFKTIFLNMVIFGNSFNEIVRTLANKVAEIDPILTETMYVKVGGGYLQIASKQVNFLEEEVMHFKLTGPRSKYYGDSMFSKCIGQITLLQNIDKYYKKLFDNGLMNPIILNDKSKELSDKDKESLKIMIQDTMKGLENAFTTVIIPGELGKVDIAKDPDTEAFLKYRVDLIKSIAISLNIPYSMLLSDSSNRATSESEFNTFTKEIVAPLQRHFLRQLKTELKKLKMFNEKAIEEIEFKAVDVKNQKTEMEIWKGYKDSGVLTANEVREFLGYDPIEGGDKISAAKTPADTQAQLDQVQDTVKKLYQD